MLRDPVTINLERKSAPAVGITQAVYPVARELKSALLVELLEARHHRRRHRLHAHEAPGQPARGVHRAARDLVGQIHGNRSQSQRTAALAGFKSGDHRVLVATDIVARGIDVEDLGHVVNFDVPADPDDYIHRVGRTARAEATGDAFTLVSPDEEGGPARHRARARQVAAARHAPGLRLRAEDDRAPRDPVRERLAAARAAADLAASAGPRPSAAARTGGPPRGRAVRRRFQAILDKHAPAGSRPGGGGPKPAGRRRG